MSSDSEAPKADEKKGFFSRWRNRSHNPDPAADSPVAPEQAVSSEPTEADEPAVPELRAEPVDSHAKQTSADQQASDSTPDKDLAVTSNHSSGDSAKEKPGSTASRFGLGLRRSREKLGRGLANLFMGQKQIDANLLDELEMLLLTSDVGVEATQKLVTELTEQVDRRSLSDSGQLLDALRQLMIEMLTPCQEDLVVNPDNQPHVIMVVGVNGVGKTTTIGKITHRLKQQGHRPILAAGDTFRAAAAEQLTEWGRRTDSPVIAQNPGADSASVIYDAVQSAQSKGHDLVIADTAGRLHNKSHLMEELSKVVRVMQKLQPSAPHEVLLVLDGGTGQNAISQATQFCDAVPVTGLVITKLDGTAKGGVLFSLAEKFNLPVRFVGLGEAAEDLQPFNAADYVDGMLRTEQDRG